MNEQFKVNHDTVRQWNQKMSLFEYNQYRGCHLYATFCFFLVIGQPLFREQDKVLEMTENKPHMRDNMAVLRGN